MQGKQCPISFEEAAQQASAALLRYESTPSAETVQQGQEPAALLTALGSDSAGFQALQECQTYNDDYQVGVLHAQLQCKTIYEKSMTPVLL